MIRVRAVLPSEWPLWRTLRLQALAEAPYAFGSRLSEWQGDGDAEWRWRDRLQSVAFNAVAEVRGTPAGMVSGADVAGEASKEAELLSLWVAPWARGRGVGDALVETVLAWAASRARDTVSLSVREQNRPAIALYRRHGFVDVGPDGGEESPELRERRMVRSLHDG